MTYGMSYMVYDMWYMAYNLPCNHIVYGMWQCGMWYYMVYGTYGGMDVGTAVDHDHDVLNSDAPCWIWAQLLAMLC